MTEKNLIINNRTITYKGVFLASELFNIINKTIKELGYQPQEKKTEEKVVPSGKTTFVELRPFKIKNNYVTLMLKVKINLNQVIEVTKEVDGLKKKFQQGEIIVIIDAWSLTDYASRWGMKPWVFFMKSFMHKYFRRLPMEEGFTGELKSDANQLTQQLKAFFSLYKYQVAELHQKTKITENKSPENTENKPSKNTKELDGSSD